MQLRCFWLSFCHGYMVKKRRHNSGRGAALHMFLGHYSTRDRLVHILDNSYFCVNRTLFPVHNAWICTQFDHLASHHGFRSSLHRTLNNTETMLFFVCFPFLMCTHTDSMSTHQKVHRRPHSGRCTSGSWTFRYLWITCEFGHNSITE